MELEMAPSLCACWCAEVASSCQGSWSARRSASPRSRAWGDPLGSSSEASKDRFQKSLRLRSRLRFLRFTNTFAENGSGFDEQGVNKGEQEDAGRAEGGHAAQKGCRALPCRVIAPDRASRPAPTDLTLVRLRRLSRGATVNGSPQHRRSSAAIEDWPVHGCCASPGTARTWRTTPQASCSDSVRLTLFAEQSQSNRLCSGGTRRGKQGPKA